MNFNDCIIIIPFGGKLHVMKHAPMRQEMAESMLDNYTKQLEKTDITITLGKEVTPDVVKEVDPDVASCATGSQRYIPPFLGGDDERIMYIDDLFTTNDFSKHERTVVFDFRGDWAGVEGAIYLAEKGCDVTLVIARLHAAENVPQYLWNEYIKRLNECSVTVEPQHDFGGIEEEDVVIRDLFTQERSHHSWERVILSGGQVPHTKLYDAIKNSDIPIYQIGDCLALRTIEEATHEGLFTALKV